MWVDLAEKSVPWYTHLWWCNGLGSGRVVKFPSMKSFNASMGITACIRFHT